MDLTTILAVVGGLNILARIITNITPTEKDNEFMNKYIDPYIDMILPNRKKGGGTHRKTIYSKVKDKING